MILQKLDQVILSRKWFIYVCCVSLIFYKDLFDWLLFIKMLKFICIISILFLSLFILRKKYFLNLIIKINLWLIKNCKFILKLWLELLNIP